MAQKLLSNSLVHLMVALLVALGVLVCVYPHVFSWFSWVVNYAVQLMLACLFAGFFFLFLKQPRLTFVCFAGCLLLCFYLKFSIKNDSIERWRNAMLKQYQPADNEVQLKTAQFNLANTSSADDIMAALRKSDADVLSIHEVNPGWSQWLEDSLSQAYPYHHIMVDLGIFGMAIFSRHPITKVDTFYYQEIPNLQVCTKKEGIDICLISVHTEPALNDYSLRRLVGQLEALCTHIGTMNVPLVVLGDFNAVSWSQELQHFMEKAGLLESRSGFMDRQRSFWDVPVDHIFHSQRLGCVDFANFSDRDGRHLGIMAAFQINPLGTYVKKTAQ